VYAIPTRNRGQSPNRKSGSEPEWEFGL